MLTRPSAVAANQVPRRRLDLRDEQRPALPLGCRGALLVSVAMRVCVCVRVCVKMLYFSVIFARFFEALTVLQRTLTTFSVATTEMHEDPPNSANILALLVLVRLHIDVSACHSCKR
jgi:hypothetical protein